MNRDTLKDKYPDMGWGKRASEYASGYEFVPNVDDFGYLFDPMEVQE